MRVLVIDPSGNFGAKEGSGTTGFAVFDCGELKDFSRVSARDQDSDLTYWDTVLEVIRRYNHDDELATVVCESYKLMGHKAMAQSGSSMDTPQLIGIIRMYCYQNGINFVFQDPKDKVRVADPILVHMGVLTQTDGGRFHALGRQTVIHERDAIRHGVFYHRYNKQNNHNVN